MSEALKIFLTASTTLIGGVMLYTLTKIFVEPIQEIRKLIGEIGYHVFLSRSLVENIKIDDDTSEERIDELEAVTDKFKDLSARLRSSVNIIPFYRFFCIIRILPSKDNLLQTAGSLSVISYCKYEHDKAKISKEIDCLFRQLKIDMYGRQ